MMPQRLRLRRSDGDRTLRVAIVAESFLPHVNGVTNSVLRVIERLRADGHEVLVIAPGPGDDSYLDVPIVRVPAISLPRYRDVRVGLPIARVTSILRGFRPHVVHLAAPTVLGAAGARAARNLGIPSVAIFQTDVVGFARRYRLGVAAPMLWAWLRFVHRQSTITLAPSTSSVWTLRAHGVPRVHQWMRGVDLQRFSPSHRCDDLRRELAPNGEVIIGFVGRLAKEKQVDRLAPVAALPGVKVVIVGDGPERAHLEKLMPDAVFTGFLGGTELGRHHASFDVFAHTGLDETFCQAVQEALASGVPVVAPAAGGPIDLVTHGHNGFLWSPEQPEMLVGACAQLAGSPLQRYTMGKAARASVEHRPWSSVLDDLLEHYRFAIDGGGRLEELVA
jgi:phosphatidylinositol alpha 1,6-mannosyltransferase